MSGLPSGTVTFAFSDIEGSTAPLKRLGDRYGELLDGHRAIVRSAFGERGGIEIDTGPPAAAPPVPRRPA